MQDKLTLMIPGPTPVPETVLKAMGRHPIGHRSGEFQAVVERTNGQLRWLHQTSSDVLVITGSGTAAMEAGIINTLSRGDRVLCGDNGKFGERWVKVARAYGLDVDVIKAEWGQPLDPEAFRTGSRSRYRQNHQGGDPHALRNLHRSDQRSGNDQQPCEGPRCGAHHR